MTTDQGLSGYLGLPLAICAVLGVLAGCIAYSRRPTGGTFLGYLLLGFLVPIVGLILACLVQRPAAPYAPPAPPSWQPDPWGQAQWRYWDGENWTAHTA